MNAHKSQETVVNDGHETKCTALQTHLANDIVLVVFLVQGQDGRNEFRNLLLQFIIGHQMAHRAHRLRYCPPQLEHRDRKSGDRRYRDDVTDSLNSNLY